MNFQTAKKHELINTDKVHKSLFLLLKNLLNIYKIAWKLAILNICTFNIVVSSNRQSKHRPLADSTYIAVDPGFFHILQQLPQRWCVGELSQVDKGSPNLAWW